MTYRPPTIALLAALAALMASAAAAQTAPGQDTTPPFRSALEGYQPFTEQQVAPWREANENVGRIGGWRAYAQEAQGGAAKSAQPAASAPAESAPSRPTAPAQPRGNGHGHH